jgi:CIC family chloride channel protein
MVIGGCTGGAVGVLLHSWFPEMVQQPAAFVVVGMAGFFSGIAKTPISSLVMVSEITGSYSLLIPSMWVCVLTFAMSRGWNLYSKQVQSRVDSPAHQGRFAIDVLRGMRVVEALDKSRVTEVLRTGDSLRKVLDSAAAAHQATFPVLDAEDNLAGIISLEQIRRVMNENLPDQIVAHDIMVAVFPRLSPEADMAEALRALSSVDVEELPVWDPQTRLVLGLISRKQLTRTYVERMASMRRAV